MVVTKSNPVGVESGPNNVSGGFTEGIVVRRTKDR